MSLLRLVWREFHDQTRTHRFMGLTALALLLTPLILYAGVRDLATRSVQSDLLSARITTSPVVGRLVEPSLRLLRLPSPTSVLVRGLDGQLPLYWDFGPDGVHRGDGPDSARRTPESGVSLDLEFLIRIVLGLLAISLAAGSLALERETGVLLVLRSQPVLPTTVLLAKLIGGSIAVGAALAVVLSGAAASLGMFGPELWSPDLKGTLLGLGVEGCVYLSTLYALGLVIGALARSASAANVAAMMTWIVVAVASVPAIELLDQVIAPVPAPEVTEARRLRDYETQRRQSEMTVGAMYQVAKGIVPQDSPSPEGLGRLKEAWQQEALAIRQRLEPIDHATAESASRQRTLWNLLVRFTPGTLFFETASRIARTGLPTAERWDTAADAYQARLDRELFDDPPQITVRVRAQSSLFLVKITFRPTSDSSAFRQGSEPMATARSGLMDALGPMILSAAYLAGCIALAFAAFLRASNYDPGSS